MILGIFDRYYYYQNIIIDTRGQSDTFVRLLVAHAQEHLTKKYGNHFLHLLLSPANPLEFNCVSKFIVLLMGHGSIQEDRHKVEQFHFLWNSSTFCGTKSRKCGTAPHKVGQHPRRPSPWQYPRRPTQSGTVPLFVEQFHFLWNSSTIRGIGPVSGSHFNKLWKRRPN